MAGKILLVEPDPLGVFANKTQINAYKPALSVNNDNLKDIDKITSEEANQAIGETLEGIQSVGRPVFGILAKPNTHAYVQVIGPKVGITTQETHNFFGHYLNDRKTREPGKMFDALKAGLDKFKNVFDAEKETAPGSLVPGEVSAAPKSPVWTDWILQSVQESRVEKTQVIETFGDSYFYAFGQKPRSISFSGLLMNTVDHNWRSIFWRNWDEYFRATKLVERGARLYIQWDEIIVEGYPINAVCSEVADSPNAMKFSFSLFVTRYVNVAAQSGFLTQQYMRIAQLRAGSGIGMLSTEKGFRLLGGESFIPQSFNAERNGMFGMEGALGLRTGEGAEFEKFSLIGQLGPNLGNTLKRLALQSEAVRDAQQTETGRALLRQVGYAAVAAQKFARLAGDERALNLSLNSFLRQLGRDIVGSAALDATNLADDAMNVRRGELNQIMTEAAVLIDRAIERTAEGKKFQLKPYTKYSTLQNMATSWINPGVWGGTYKDRNGVERGWGTRTGGITVVGSDSAPFRDVVTAINEATPGPDVLSLDFPSTI